MNGERQKGERSRLAPLLREAGYVRDGVEYVRRGGYALRAEEYLVRAGYRDVVVPDLRGEATK